MFLKLIYLFFIYDSTMLAEGSSSSKQNNNEDVINDCIDNATTESENLVKDEKKEAYCKSAELIQIISFITLVTRR